MKGRLTKHTEGWRCTCAGTWTGYGATPARAWHAWLEALRLARQPGDAYDQADAAYRRMEWPASG